MFTGEPYRRDELTTRSQEPRPTGGRPGLPRGTRLPLEAEVETTAFGCNIRLPVRAEHVTVDKRPVVVEEVAVHTTQVDDSVHVDDTVRREGLEVDTAGDVRVTERRRDATGELWTR